MQPLGLYLRGRGRGAVRRWGRGGWGGAETLSRSYNPTLEPIKGGRATIRLPSPAAMLNTSAGAKRLLGAPWGGS